ncbi:MAG: class I SAM-dependent methyltransferase [Candidatus Promineifilaceae bacterium]|nr:class I SAM-dependent methyltransferase [Candidatus Promineifilaceae bacterium]
MEARRQVIQRELLWHEQESHRRHRLDSLLYDPPAFEDLVEQSIGFLQIRPGERVLDIGCGEGKETVNLASRGLFVIGTDLSMTQLIRARELIQKEYPAAKFSLLQANAERLPFANSSFRIIHGKAILHHLDLDISARETRRLLTARGRATFAEPLARHLIIWLGRRLTPRLRTRDEQPVELRDLEYFGQLFTNPKLQTYYITAPLAYVFRLLPKGEQLFSAIYSQLSRIDQMLLKRFKVLREFAWYAAIHVQAGTNRISE